MATDVSWMLELNVQHGREEEFAALMEEMVSATQDNEAGTLDYQWSTSADGTACHIFERYGDSTAVLVHLATFGERFAGRFMEILAPVRFVVYGSPSQEVKDALAAFNPTFMEPAGGFSR
jgi:quinol monooxygenase YgiN